jgi:glycyl-tRNA synthetase
MATPGTSNVNKTAHPFTRDAFDELMKQRFFFTQAFEIYGGES